MCGITGSFAMRESRPPDPAVLAAMTMTLTHRGPDGAGQFIDGGVGLGFRRLSIIDLAGGEQPIRNEDGSVVMVCNGEIFNYRQLRAELLAKGHRFRSDVDVEVLVHLYEEHGPDMLGRLNGQFAFALYDKPRQRLMLARDQLGILPLHYAGTPDVFVFGSEIKAVLRHPRVEASVDLTGLDQVLTFPGLISPRTMFRGVRSLESGHYLLVGDGEVRKVKYWDLDYPLAGDEAGEHSDEYYVDTLRDLLADSVRLRLRADVPVGFYLSGGLDSSLIAALVHEARPTNVPHSFSIAFPDAEIDESGFQRMMAAKVGSRHHELTVGTPDIEARLRRMVYHAECPVKETYNTCSMALAQSVNGEGVRVVLTGEGADELFGGYVGYRFDQAQPRRTGTDLDSMLEADLRGRLWGEENLFYERDYHSWREQKLELYSDGVREVFRDVDCLSAPMVDTGQLRGRDPLHQRSYLDFKLRLADHLLADHGDRMALAHSVEARYPFLDIRLVEFARRVPPRLKVNEFTEKYILKQIARDLVPAEIVGREKFGFRAPGSPGLLRGGSEWVADMLSYDRIKRQGYFSADVVEHLRTRYREPGFTVHPHLGDDLLLIVLTFGLLLEEFGLPDHT